MAVDGHINWEAFVGWLRVEDRLGNEHEAAQALFGVARAWENSNEHVEQPFRFRHLNFRNVLKERRGIDDVDGPFDFLAEPPGE